MKRDCESIGPKGLPCVYEDAEHTGEHRAFKYNRLVDAWPNERDAADMTPDAVRIDHLIVDRAPEPTTPGAAWCLHSSEPHSAWIEFFATKKAAIGEARAMLARRTERSETR